MPLIVNTNAVKYVQMLHGTQASNAFNLNKYQTDWLIQYYQIKIQSKQTENSEYQIKAR